jgi:hypothetical protein
LIGIIVTTSFWEMKMEMGRGEEREGQETGKMRERRHFEDVRSLNAII